MKNNLLIPTLVMVGFVGWFVLKQKSTQIVYVPAPQPPVRAPQSETQAVAATPPTTVQQAKIEVTAEDPIQKKSSLLDAILASRNDNDPRLDTDFKNLNEDEKGLIQKNILNILKKN